MHMKENADSEHNDQTEVTENQHTFIIPAYKESKFLEDCIKSLKRQTTSSTIIITTSTPSDFISEIARKYNIEVFINVHGGSIARDWNFAYKICKTKYLTLAHQDDIYLPDYTEKCLHYTEKKTNSKTLLVFTDYEEVVFNKKKKISIVIIIKKLLLFVFLFKNIYKNRFVKRGLLSFGNTIACPTVMFNTQNIGTFEFAEKYHYVLDWEAWLRLAKRDGKFVYINRKLMLHRIHNESETTYQMKGNNREKEEEMIFSLIWKKPFAGILMSIYKLGAKLSANALD
jgi:glycosyltransferase involved in cell wall biosynthesis